MPLQLYERRVAMGRLRFALSVIDNISEWTVRIIGFVIPLIVVLIGYEVVMRYIFNQPTIWVHELSLLLWGSLFMLAGAYILLHGGHVNMDLVYARLSPRKRAIIDLVTSLLFFFFCGVLLWKGWIMASKSLAILEHSGSFWNPPVYLVKLTIPLGAFLLILQGIAKFVRDLMTTATGREFT